MHTKRPTSEQRFWDDRFHAEDAALRKKNGRRSDDSRMNLAAVLAERALEIRHRYANGNGNGRKS